MKLFSLIFILFTVNAWSAQNYFCDDSLDSIPTLQGGRVKPLYVHAGETIKHLTGSKKIDGLSATVSFCLLSVKSMGLQNEIKPMLVIEHPKVRDLLSLKEGQKKISYERASQSFQDLRLEWMRMKEETSFKKSLGSVMGKIQMYQNLISGSLWTVPRLVEGQWTWPAIHEFFQQDEIEKLAGSTDQPFLTALKNAERDYVSEKGDDHMLELKYARAQLPLWSLLLTLLALAAGVLAKSFTPTLLLAGSTVAVQTALLVLRTMISGRAPITNMYETVLFSGYGALVLAMIVGHFQKERIFVFVGLGYNFCTLMMLNFAHGMLSATISPLVPVLRDNFWLSTHVTTIILSYGALALSWILANAVLVRRKWFNMDMTEYKRTVDLTYTCLKFGVVLLAAGIILGGVWADYSWGRFWGWDPKETWSLIVLCVYIAILHGKYTNWIPAKRFIPLTAGAFMSVMMAWFGVNYILASGLHSYGFSEGGAIFLGTFFLIQTALLIVTGKVTSEVSRTVEKGPQEAGLNN